MLTSLSVKTFWGFHLLVKPVKLRGSAAAAAEISFRASCSLAVLPDVLPAAHRHGASGTATRACCCWERIRWRLAGTVPAEPVTAELPASWCS